MTFRKAYAASLDVLRYTSKRKTFHLATCPGPHFRDYSLMLDDQGEQIFVDDGCRCRARAEDRRDNRSLDRPNLASSAIADNDAQYARAARMIAELRDDNAILIQSMRETHSLCDEGGRRGHGKPTGETGLTKPRKRNLVPSSQCGRHP